MTPEGLREYSVYTDSREVAADFSSGVISPGSEILYQGLICEVFCDFEDEDGVRFCELIAKGGLGNNIQFTVM